MTSKPEHLFLHLVTSVITVIQASGGANVSAARRHRLFWQPSLLLLSLPLPFAFFLSPPLHLEVGALEVGTLKPS